MPQRYGVLARMLRILQLRDVDNPWDEPVADGGVGCQLIESGLFERVHCLLAGGVPFPQANNGAARSSGRFASRRLLRCCRGRNLGCCKA